jgi:hypothetical protein
LLGTSLAEFERGFIVRRAAEEETALRTLLAFGGQSAAVAPAPAPSTT